MLCPKVYECHGIVYNIAGNVFRTGEIRNDNMVKNMNCSRTTHLRGDRNSFIRVVKLLFNKIIALFINVDYTASIDLRSFDIPTFHVWMILLHLAKYSFGFVYIPVFMKIIMNLWILNAFAVRKLFLLSVIHFITRLLFPKLHSTRL